MTRAVWKGTVIAETADPVVVEGSVYFPADDVHRVHLRPSEERTVCGWKGVASYYDVVVGDEVNAGAAWTYLEPKEAAQEITGRIAFWRGVIVEG